MITLFYFITLSFGVLYSGSNPDVLNASEASNINSNQNKFCEVVEEKWHLVDAWNADTLTQAVDDLLKEFEERPYLNKAIKELTLNYVLVGIWQNSTFCSRSWSEGIINDQLVIKKSLNKLIQAAMEGDFLPKFSSDDKYAYYVRSKSLALCKQIAKLVGDDREDKFCEETIAYLASYCGKKSLDLNSIPGSILREVRLACLDENDYSRPVKLYINNGIIKVVVGKNYYIKLGKISDVAKINKSQLKAVVQSLIYRLNEPVLKCITSFNLDFCSNHVECMFALDSQDLDAVVVDVDLGHCFFRSLDDFFRILDYVESIELCDNKVKINFKYDVADEDKQQINSILFNKSLKYLAACRYLNILSFFNIARIN